jgi:diguanylate cyclase (GGDEF)-like protein
VHVTWCGLLLALAGTVGAEATDSRPIVVDGLETRYDLTGTLEVLADPTNGRTIDAVASASEAWGSPPSLVRTPGVQVYWVRLRLESRLPDTAEYVLVPERFWQEVELYVPEASGGFSVQRSGSRTAFFDRPLPHSTVLLPLQLKPGVTEGYVRFRSDFGGYAPPRRIGLKLESQASFFRSEAREHEFHGIYAGIILAMVLYNLFLFLAVRERVYLLYVLYAGTFGSIWVVRSGLAFERVWPGWPRWNEVSTFYLIGAALLFGTLFVQAFLDTRRHAPRLHRAAWALLAGVGAAILVGLAGRWLPAERLMAYLSLLACAGFIACGVLALRQGYRPARIYLAACGALLLGVIVYVITYLGLLPRTFLTVFGVQIGSAAEVLLLAFALGDRINLLRREREQAQALYRLGLEREVRQRTEDLGEANRRLHEANDRLARLSMLDELTGVANRRQLEAVLDAEWRRCTRTQQPLSVALLDVDHFKDFNDRYGHPAGDRCLQAVAGALAERCVRAGDLVARYGGEEFVVVMPGTDRAGAALLAERLRQGVEALGIAHTESAPFPVVTISAGVGSVYPTEDEGSDVLLAEADAALYAAKRQGRNRVVHEPTPAAR